MPVEQRCSISAQSLGEEHETTRPVAFSTQRKAGMFSLEPSRIPAWLAPVCDEFGEGQTYLKVPMDGSFGIEAGSRTAQTNIDGSPLMEGVSGTMEWEAASASYPPVEGVHASSK